MITSRILDQEGCTNKEAVSSQDLRKKPSMKTHHAGNQSSVVIFATGPPLKTEDPIWYGYCLLPFMILAVGLLFLSHFPTIGSSSVWNQLIGRERAGREEERVPLKKDHLVKIKADRVINPELSLEGKRVLPSGTELSGHICRKGREPRLSNDELLRELKPFVEVYDKRLGTLNLHGTGMLHQFALWCVIRKLKPDFIVESGVMHGHGTWIMRQAAPEAQIILLDKVRERLEYVDPNPDTVFFMGQAQGRFKDFSDIDWNRTRFAGKAFDPTRALVFFDDHKDAVKRVLQAERKGFRHIMFDDNYSPHLPDNESPVDSFSLKTACAAINGKLTLRQQFGNFVLTQQDVDRARKAFQSVRVYFEFPSIWPRWNSHGNVLLPNMSEQTLFKSFPMSHPPPQLNRKYHFICYVQLETH